MTCAGDGEEELHMPSPLDPNGISASLYPLGVSGGPMDPSPASEPQGTMLFGCSDSGPSFEGVGGDSSSSDRESSSSSDSDRNRIEDDPDSRAASPSLRYWV